MMCVNVANNQGGIMNHDKLQEYSKIAAGITATMDTLIQVQSLFVDLLLKECDIPREIKETMLKDMNKFIGKVSI
jgi:hypothetical protein